MYRLLFVLLIAMAISAADKGDFMKHCGKIFNAKNCCKDKLKMSEDLVTVLNECSQLPGAPACDQDICIATKKGYGTADGKIDFDKALKATETILAEQPKMLASAKAHCFDPNLYKNAPADLCELIILRHCLELNVVLECSGWSDDSSCATVKTDLEDCANFMKTLK